MDAPVHDSGTSQHGAPVESLDEALRPGVLSIGDDGSIRFGDPRAMELLGCAPGAALASLWGEIRPRLEAAGLRWSGGSGHPGTNGASGSAALDLPANGTRLLFDLHPGGAGGESGGLLLISDARVAEALAADLRLSSQMRALSQISPAVAHDLRAPINAMVFNIEVLKETLAAGPSLDPAMRDRQLRYVNVLKEELNRLHRSLEIFLAHTSPRGDRVEVLDLRELAEELAALLVGPARKQQVQVRPEMAAAAVHLEANRYQLRQALLHLALAVLGPVPRQGTLEVRLESHDGAARLSIAGSGPAPEKAEAAETAGTNETAGDRAEPGFDLRYSPTGTAAQLHVARGILTAQGAKLKRLSTGGGPAYEVEWLIPDIASDKE
jgi:signal transduction histidine kinase